MEGMAAVEVRSAARLHRVFAANAFFIFSRDKRGRCTMFPENNNPHEHQHFKQQHENPQGQPSPRADAAKQSVDLSALESLARIAAPEDIRVGDFVAPLHDLDQYAIRDCESSMWETDEHGRKRSPLRVATVRSVAKFTAVYRVLAVALPVVLLEDSDGDQRLMSVRAHIFGVLPAALGKVAMHELDTTRRKEKRKSRRAAEKRRVRREASFRGASGAD